MLSETASDNADKTSGAASRIQAGPVPDWVTDRSYNSTFKARPGDQLTYLLFDRQIHAERREDFFHGAIRLETMEGVQRHSQWQLPFEPSTQSVALHFIKIRRGETSFDHLYLEKGRLIQREEGLNRFVIDGWFTFLLILEDVRPGDVLEWAFTVTTTPRLLPEYAFHYCGLPEGVPLGTYRFSVRFSSARPMQWKSFWDSLKPTEVNDDGLTRWTWIGNDYAGSKPEINTPFWHLSSPWIQVSDCPDWAAVARAVSQVWAQQESTSRLDELVRQIEVDAPDLPARIVNAIQLVQDDFRYLSVDLEFGGQIPASPDVVARRRYGDCKDLSFLLVQLLKRLGVAARPILVNSRIRKNIRDLLPSPNIFDHAIVEFEAEGNRRWIDPTIKKQGGGAFNRTVPNYGLGLPIEPGISALAEAPQLPAQSNLFEFHETFMLDTTGAFSLVAAVVRAEGSQAELLRNEFSQSSLEAIAKKRLQSCANRYARAKRIGTLQYRDDRADNQFVLTEVFEINGFLQQHTKDRNWCRFPIPSRWLHDTLPLPAKGERRTPFFLPYPCQIVHIVDVEFPGMKPHVRPRYTAQNQFLKFERTHKAGNQFWVMTFSLITCAEEIPADQINQHRETIADIWNQSAWELNLPIGQSRQRQKRGFGELPPPPRPKFIRPATAAPQPAPVQRPVEPIVASPANKRVESHEPELLPPTAPVIAKPPAKPGPALAPGAEENSRRRKKRKAGFWQRLFGA